MNTQEAKAELARILGEDAQGIRVENPRWLTLMQSGVIVKLHIRRWRARASLSLRDLGLSNADTDADEQRAFAELLQLGEKRLMPAELLKRLEACEAAGRKALVAAGYATYYGTFVPASNYQQWRAENESLAARYAAIGAEIVAEYDRWHAELLAAYRTQARVAYRRLQMLSPDSMDEDERWNEALFVADFTARIERLIPAPETIAEAFGWEAELSYIPLPSLLAEDNAEKERVEAARALERQREDFERDSLWAAISLEDAALRQRQAQLSAMNADIIDKAKREKETLVGGFLRDVIVQLRTLVYDVTTNVLDTMRNNDGQLHGRSVVQLRNLIGQVERLNFAEDHEVKAMVAQVQNALDGTTARAAASVADRLRDVATVTRASLLALGETPRQARDLPDVTPDNDLLCARRRLNLPALTQDDVTPLFTARRRQTVDV